MPGHQFEPNNIEENTWESTTGDFKELFSERYDVLGEDIDTSFPPLLPENPMVIPEDSALENTADSNEELTFRDIKNLGIDSNRLEAIGQICRRYVRRCIQEDTSYVNDIDGLKQKIIHTLKTTGFDTTLEKLNAYLEKYEEDTLVKVCCYYIKNYQFKGKTERKALEVDKFKIETLIADPQHRAKLNGVCSAYLFKFVCVLEEKRKEVIDSLQNRQWPKGFSLGSLTEFFKIYEQDVLMEASIYFVKNYNTRVSQTVIETLNFFNRGAGSSNSLPPGAGIITHPLTLDTNDGKAPPAKKQKKVPDFPLEGSQAYQMGDKSFSTNNIQLQSLLEQIVQPPTSEKEEVTAVAVQPKCFQFNNIFIKTRNSELQQLLSNATLPPITPPSKKY